MSCYAPLFVNVNPGAMQWRTDLIGYDASNSYGSPSYYAQCLFAAHLGDGTAKSSVTGAGPRFFYSATVSSKTKTLHLKLVNASDKPQPLTLKIGGGASGRGHREHAAWRVLSGDEQHQRSGVHPSGGLEDARHWTGNAAHGSASYHRGHRRSLALMRSTRRRD